MHFGRVPKRLALPSPLGEKVAHRPDEGFSQASSTTFGTPHRLEFARHFSPRQKAGARGTLPASYPSTMLPIFSAWRSEQVPARAASLLFALNLVVGLLQAFAEFLWRDGAAR